MSEFTVAPWVPPDSFVKANEWPLSDIYAYIRQQFPQTRQDLDFNVRDGFPEDPEQLAAIAAHFDTTPTETGELRAEAIRPRDDHRAQLSRMITKLRYGPHHLNRHTPHDHFGQYDQARLEAGTAAETTSRLRALSKYTNEIVIFAGQQLRDDSAPRGQSFIANLKNIVLRHTGTAKSSLSNSPWLSQELDKGEANDNPWEQGLATCTDVSRLVVESLFYGLINWDDYEAVVKHDVGQASGDEPLPCVIDGETYAVPPRPYELVSYTLRDGRMVRVVNGRDIGQSAGRCLDANGIAARHFRAPQDARIVIARNLPHFSAGLDAVAETLLDPAAGPALGRVDLAIGRAATNHQFGNVPVLRDLPNIAAADKRLREALFTLG